MDKKRKITLGVATLAVALGAGHMVQSGKHPGAATKVAEATEAKPTGITPLAASAVPDVPAAAPIAAKPAPVVPKVISQVAPSTPSAKPGAAPVPVPASLTPDTTKPATPKPAEQADACRATLDVIPGANGMLDLTLLSPCQSGTRVVLRHGGLAVTARTSSGGALFTALPALESDGEVTAMFPDGTVARGAAPVDLTGLRRFAVQWLAEDRFGLNAYQGGAAWGAPGHVHAGAKGDPAGNAGWLMPLGDATVDLPMLAEVYTWPAKASEVTVDIEAAVTEATCDRELLGETLDAQAGTVVRSDITLAMPDCSAVGDFLVLNNLAAGMTTAAAE